MKNIEEKNKWQIEKSSSYKIKNSSVYSCQTYVTQAASVVVNFSFILFWIKEISKSLSRPFTKVIFKHCIWAFKVEYPAMNIIASVHIAFMRFY